MSFQSRREQGEEEEEEEAGIEDGDSDKLLCSTGRAQLWSFLAARLNLGRSRSSILLSPLAVLLVKAKRGRMFAVRQTFHLVSKDLSRVRYRVIICYHIFPVLIHLYPFTFRSKGLGQIRGAQSLPIPTAIKVSSQTAVQCCVVHSIPGKSR